MKRQRVIGTTIETIRREEAELGRALPPSLVEWLLANNGISGVAGISIFPIKDDRDLRMTWDSIFRQYGLWRDYCLDVFEDEEMGFYEYLPFANFGTGDYYCFDYSDVPEDGEPVVLHWSHETGETTFRAENFSAFLREAEAGAYEYD